MLFLFADLRFGLAGPVFDLVLIYICNYRRILLETIWFLSDFEEHC